MKESEKSNNTRKQRGKPTDSVFFPTPDAKLGMPVGYKDFIKEIKERIQHRRLETVIAANVGMIMLYWDIGNAILQRQTNEG